MIGDPFPNLISLLFFLELRFMKKHLILFATILLKGFYLVSAQEKEMQKANAFYRDYDYVQAIKAYERIASKGFENQQLLENLGNAYYYNADYKNAFRCYEKLFLEEKYDVKTELYYRYAQTLKSVGKYDESNKIMEQFTRLAPNDSRAILFKENANYQKVIQRNSGRFELYPLRINSKHSEYGTAFHGDKVVFSQSSGNLLEGKSNWTGATYYDLYEARKDSIDLLQPRKIKRINTRFNESTATFTKDGNTVYFTRNNYVNNKIRTDGDNTVLLKILKATKDKNGKWGKVVEMPFNSNIHNVAHPALSPDEKYLYFASDMKGTYGSSDIYRVKRLKNGGYGKPENLGNVVNTTGRESFPFISKDNILYYSSDGYPGLGGLDIFAVKLNNNEVASKPTNIGIPGNSEADDFCFVFDNDSKIGYLTSNRLKGQGKDDIYGFYEHSPLVFDCKRNIRGVVKNAKTAEVLAQANIYLFDVSNQLVEKQNSQKQGDFSFVHPIDCYETENFVIKVEKEGFQTVEKNIVFKELEDFSYEIELNPFEEAIVSYTKGEDLGKILKIENIYFDFDKSDIRSDAAIQLAKIVKVMQEYPKMKIDVRLHTDSRGSDKYNLALSQRRTQSTIKWLVSNGIDKNRITGRGYGETRLTNHCSNGVACSEEEHQANRRSEFIIIEM